MVITIKRIFVGPKQVTIENSDFFDASITLFGENTRNNTSFQRQVTFEFWNPDNIFIEIDIYNKEIAKLSEPTEIMAHNPRTLLLCTLPKYVHLICKNDESILEVLDNKIQTRNLVKNIVPMLDYHIIQGQDFEYQYLCHISDELVVQLPTGSGGSKTFLCNKENHQDIVYMLKPQEYYSVSAFQRKNIPYNIHCMIGYDQIELFAPSKQNLEILDKIEYIGSDFNIDIPAHIGNRIISYSTDVCKKLQEMGYRGVLGIDYIETGGKVYFIEINPRFQGSTRQLDALLKMSKLPSIFDYNYRAFNRQEMPSTKHMLLSIMSVAS